ncbi:contact-dependent growth inhibition system immunity protein [Streptomyces sp. NPDC048516]|uniref:contact-dependent growth inhibition system immunity protein n=1 Tax=Streptomyces sp. NPDC048516 TaxID=3365565 RepID=UPI00371CC413
MAPARGWLPTATRSAPWPWRAHPRPVPALCEESMKNSPIDHRNSIAELESSAWPDPPEGSTNLVKSVHALRRQPIGDLTPEELARLIGQNVGLPWILPLALEFLRDTAPHQATGGWYDDDLLSAVLTRKSDVWSASPELAQEVDAILRILTDLSPYIQRDVKRFRAALPSGE